MAKTYKKVRKSRRSGLNTFRLKKRGGTKGPVPKQSEPYYENIYTWGIDENGNEIRTGFTDEAQKRLAKVAEGQMARLQKLKDDENSFGVSPTQLYEKEYEINPLSGHYNSNNRTSRISDRKSRTSNNRTFSNRVSQLYGRVKGIFGRKKRMTNLDNTV